MMAVASALSGMTWQQKRTEFPQSPNLVLLEKCRNDGKEPVPNHVVFASLRKLVMQQVSVEFAEEDVGHLVIVAITGLVNPLKASPRCEE